MYVKLVRNLTNATYVVSNIHGDTDHQVIPSEIAIYASSFVKYAKKPCPTVQEEAEVPTRESSCFMPFDDPMEFQGECFEIALFHNGRHITVYATGCTLYVMNERGKTVDSAVCLGE